MTRRRASGRHGAGEGVSQHAARFFYRCTEHSSYVPADAGFQCDTAAVPGDTIKETDCIIVRGAYNKHGKCAVSFYRLVKRNCSSYHSVCYTLMARDPLFIIENTLKHHDNSTQ